MSASNKDNLPNKILVVDDDESVLKSVQKGLEKYNIRVDVALKLETALYHFNQNRYDVALLEIEFEDLPGLALIQKWRRHENIDKRATAFILTSGQKRNSGDDALIGELGDAEVITKPFSIIKLLPYLSRGKVTRNRALAFGEVKEKVLNFYTKNKAFDEAAAFVRKRLKEFGPKGLHLLIDLYEKAGKYEDALAVTESMLDTNPEDIALINAKGRLLMLLGKHKEAAKALEQADKVAPKNIDRINEMATLYLHLKEPQKSVNKMQQLIDLSPEDPDVKFDLYARLYDFGYDDEACQLGKQNSSPMEIVRHYNNKGVLLSREGRSQEALDEYSRAVRFFPKFKENYRIYYNMALAYVSKKTRASYQKAAEYLQKCIDLKSDFDKARITLEKVNKALNSSKKKKSAS